MLQKVKRVDTGLAGLGSIRCRARRGLQGFSLHGVHIWASTNQAAGMNDQALILMLGSLGEHYKVPSSASRKFPNLRSTGAA